MQRVLKSHCIRGHLYDAANTYISTKGHRVCRACLKITRPISSSKRLFGGWRETTILRDGEKCVKCGMTRAEHRAKYNCDITVDHIDGRGKYTPQAEKNNDPSNLQTLCMPCHGRKDWSRAVPKSKLTAEDVLDIRMFRAAGLYLSEIYKGYQMCYRLTIQQAAAGSTWSKLPNAFPRKRLKPRLPKSEADHA